MGLITENARFSVNPIALVANGTVDGKLILQDSSRFRVGQILILHSSTQPPLRAKVKRCREGGIVYVGGENTRIEDRIDVSAYTVADVAFVVATEQPRSKIPEEKIERFTYEEEPIVARRVVMVDEEGNIYTDSNPMPVNAAVSIGDVQVDLNSELGDTVGIGAHQNSIFAENSTIITTDSFETIFSYASTDDKTRIMGFHVTVNTPTVFNIKIGTTIIRTVRSSPMERNVDVAFLEHRKLLLGETVTVEAKVDRKFMATYESFVAMEGYLRR